MRVLVLALGLIIPSNVIADEERTVTVTQVDEKKFPEVELTLEVRNHDGSFLLDATKESFKVKEYDVEVPILKFEAPQSLERKATTIVLVLDHSGSMSIDDRIGGLKLAVASFLEGLPPGSRVGVIGFSSKIRVICPFTEDFSRVQAAVDGLTPTGGTKFYDAVAAGLELIAEEDGRRAVLAMTDGMDTESRVATVESIVTLATKLSLPVHTLSLGKEASEASNNMKKMSEASRGQYYAARDADNLKSIYEEIAQRLRSSYSLTYKTERTLPDGTLRPVKVFFAGISQAAEASVYVKGMVVPAPGWSWLLCMIVAGLLGFNWFSTRMRRTPI